MDFIQNELKEIKELLKKQIVQQKEFLTVLEAADFLGLSKHQIHKITSRKEISFYKPGGKIIYFKKSDLEEWVFKNKVLSNDELEADVEDYLSGTNKNLTS